MRRGGVSRGGSGQMMTEWRDFFDRSALAMSNSVRSIWVHTPRQIMQGLTLPKFTA
jgi:hypothetical protein